MARRSRDDALGGPTAWKKLVTGRARKGGHGGQRSVTALTRKGSRGGVRVARLLGLRKRASRPARARVLLLVPCGLVARSARDTCYPRNAEVRRSVGSVSRRELHGRQARHTHVRCVGQRVGRVTAASGNTHPGPLAASGAMRLPPTVRACDTARLGNVLRGCSQRAVSEWPGTRPHDWRRHSRSPSRLSYRFRRRPSRSDRRLRPRHARS
jgi:hypothetical protein